MSEGVCGGDSGKRVQLAGRRGRLAEMSIDRLRRRNGGEMECTSGHVRSRRTLEGFSSDAGVTCLGGLDSDGSFVADESD